MGLNLAHLFAHLAWPIIPASAKKIHRLLRRNACRAAMARRHDAGTARSVRTGAGDSCAGCPLREDHRRTSGRVDGPLQRRTTTLPLREGRNLRSKFRGEAVNPRTSTINWTKVRWKSASKAAKNSVHRAGFGRIFGNWSAGRGAIPNRCMAIRSGDSTMTYTVGSYLATRLSQIGLKHHFVVAGDFNLVLLDQLLTNKDLEQVGCCNELNCGYSAEGYARACGAAAAVVTFSVGGLSAINAIAGAYAENLPVIMISGAPNTNDRASEHLVHHTLATHDWSYQFEIAKKVTCAAVSITSAAMLLIRSTTRSAPRYARESPPISRSPATSRTRLAPRPGRPVQSSPKSRAIAPRWMQRSVPRPNFSKARRSRCSLIGSKLRAAGAEKQAIELAEALGCAVTVMAAAKSFFPEDHPQFAGIYWGEVSCSRRARDRRLGGCHHLHRRDLQRLFDGRLDRDAERSRRADGGQEAASHFGGHDFGNLHLRDFLSRPRPQSRRSATPQWCEYQTHSHGAAHRSARRTERQD